MIKSIISFIGLLFTSTLCCMFFMQGALAHETGFEHRKDHPVDAIYTKDPAQVNVTDYGEFTPVENIGSLAQKVLNFLLAILGGVAMLGLIAGGVMVMSGGVSEETKEQGKTLLIYSIIGVVVALLSMVIVTISQSLFYSLDA